MSYYHKSYYKNCIHCNKASNGRMYCYDCYIKYYKLSDETMKLIYGTQEANQLCVICEKPSGKYEYCKDCYNRYAKKDNQIANSKSKSIKKDDHVYSKSIGLKYHEPDIKTKSGIKVRSKSECLIADFLTEYKIEFIYEKPLYYDFQQNLKPINPDFYIEKSYFSTKTNLISKLINRKYIENVYIEHFGGAQSDKPEEQIKYWNKVKYKIPIYRRLGITLICTYEEDIKDLENLMIYKLTHYEKGKVNFFKEG